jgi:hypothetical protein
MPLTIALLIAATAFAANAAPVYYLATGQTGGQTQIDTDHSSEWLFTPNVDFEFGGALLTMKAGQNASAAIVLSVYEGTDSSGTSLGSSTLNGTQFCAQTSNCATFVFHLFSPTPSIAFAAGSTYFVTLTSTAPDVQSRAYFIKNETYFISDVNGTEIVPSPIGPSIPTSPIDTAIPEPGTYGLMIASAGLLGLSRLRNAQWMFRGTED